MEVEPAASRGEAERGREAAAPGEIPPRGWRDVLSRVKESLSRDNLSVISAGVAFYALLAVFPGLAALILLYGLAFDPQQAQEQLEAFGAVLPQEAREVVLGQLGELTATDTGTLGTAAVGSLLLALWSASAGIKTLMLALNVAYHEREKRGFVRFNATALLLTLAAILGAITAIAAVVALPAIISFLHLGDTLESLARYARWPILALAMVLGLSVVYRVGPSRDAARWSWVSWGAVIATVLWLAGSALFSFYVSHFANYNKTYGSMGAIVILLLWFLLTAYSVLIGAEINAEMERQTRKDTTVGQPHPLGWRRAYAADTVGRAARG